MAAAAVVVPVEDTPGGEGGGLRARVRGAADTGRPPGHLLAERWPAAAPRQHLAQLRGRPHRLHASRGPRSHHPDISQSGDHLQPPAGGGGGGAAGWSSEDPSETGADLPPAGRRDPDHQQGRDTRHAPAPGQGVLPRGDQDRVLCGARLLHLAGDQAEHLSQLVLVDSDNSLCN